jgi:hypothetical protein
MTISYVKVGNIPEKSVTQATATAATHLHRCARLLTNMRENEQTVRKDPTTA